MNVELNKEEKSNQIWWKELKVQNIIFDDLKEITMIIQKQRKKEDKKKIFFFFEVNFGGLFSFIFIFFFWIN